MAEDIGDKIVERLREEGQLTRNTGTNSIKAVRTELAKFNVVLESINTNIAEQTQILRETLQLNLVEAGKNERARQIAEADRSEQTRERTAPPTPEPAERAGGAGAAGGLGGLLSLFGAGGFGGVTGAAAAGILGALRRPLRTALLTVVAPSVGKFIGDAVEEGMLQIGSDPSTAANFGEAANLGGLFGMIGLAFGKRAGLIGAGAGVAASFGDDVLDAVGLDQNRVVSILGQEMRLETLAQGIMGSLGASVTAAAASESFRTSLTNFFKDSVDADGNPLSRFPRRRALIGATIGSAVLGAYITYADDLKSWIDNQELPEPVAGVAKAGVDIAGMVATGASFGMMFGPKGALVGAGIGLAIGVGKSLYDWIIGRQEEAAEEARRRTEEAYDVLQAGGTPTTQAVELATTSSEEAARNRELGQGPTYSPAVVTAANILGSQREEAVNDIVSQLEGTGVFQVGSFTSESLRNALRDLKADEDVMQNPQIVRLVEDLRDSVGLSEEEITSILLSIKNSQAAMDPRSILGANNRQYRTGTRGFQDFGEGSFAVLHGREAVVPETTPAGQFLKNYFDENWQPLMNRISEVSSAAVSQGAAVVNFTPITMAPITNNNVRGGSSSTVIAAVNGDRRDLDYLSRPGGVQ